MYYKYETSKCTMPKQKMIEIEGMLVPAHWHETNKKKCAKVRSTIKAKASAKPNVREALDSVMCVFPKDEVCAVAVSGGLDSQSILYSLVEQGRKPIVLSVCFKHQKSSDFKAAQAAAKYFDLKFVPVYLPMDVEKYNKYVRWAIKKYRTTKKPTLECLWPMMLLINKAAKLGVKYIAFGHGADLYFNSTRATEMFGKDILYETRIASFKDFTWGEFGQDTILTNYAMSKGMLAKFPYNEARVYVELQNTHSWEEANVPQKRPVREAYADYLDPCKIKRHSNMQLGDGDITGNIQKMVIGSKYNTGGWKSSVAYYNALGKELLSK